MRACGSGMSGFQQLHTLDVSGNRLRRLSRGLGALFLYHALRHTDLACNPWEMPTQDVCAQVPTRIGLG
jgi:hypothetical protein